MKLLIENGRLIDPANHIDGIRNIAVADGKIVAITEADVPVSGFSPDRTIDAGGLVVSPGFVDLAARLREPGYEHKATLESEMQAAVAGGVTSLVCPPDTDPVLDEPGLVEMLKYRAAARNQAHVYPLGALTVGLKGQKLTEMAELSRGEEAFPLLYGCGSTAGIAAALEKGRVTAIAAVNVFSAGYLAVEAAAKLARHESWTGASSVGFSIVRQETMYSSDNQKLLFPVT